MADRRDEVFRETIAELIRELKTLEAEATGDVRATLEAAEVEIVRRMAAGPSEWDATRLSRLRTEIAEILRDAGAELGAAQAEHLDSGFQAGTEIVDRPVERAIGVRLDGLLNSPDKRQLLAMKSFMTDRMQGITADTVVGINGQLGLVLAGVNTPSQAIAAIAPQIEGGRARALTVVRTELGRAFSTANQQRQVQASKVLPGLRKQWRRSGKIHSRLTHDLADGQIRKPEEPFMVGGIPIMFPRDPKAPAKHTINCGCVQLPYMARWEMSQPGQQPISREEMAGSEGKRRIADVRASQVDRWAKTLLDQRRTGQAKPTGSWQGVAQIEPDVRAALERRGVPLASAEVAISDRALLHAARPSKANRHQAVPDRDLQRIAEHLDQPMAIMFSQATGEPTLHYVFHVPGQTKLGHAVVGLRRERGDERPKIHNRVVTVGLADRAGLNDPARYDILKGKL
ncbi:hypothetical protein [Inquilinus sp. CA228]|uniref:hypothetical protein n=1 Tax=Inquilinus sp. CA228 TaxID=3455609 RepID=UPI003F8D7AE2